MSSLLCQKINSVNATVYLSKLKIVDYDSSNFTDVNRCRNACKEFLMGECGWFKFVRKVSVIL